jgi:hypothetical protein
MSELVRAPTPARLPDEPTLGLGTVRQAGQILGPAVGLGDGILVALGSNWVAFGEADTVELAEGVLDTGTVGVAVTQRPV